MSRLEAECPFCRGSGDIVDDYSIQPAWKCPRCRGTGVLPWDKLYQDEKEEAEVVWRDGKLLTLEEICQLVEDEKRR